MYCFRVWIRIKGGPLSTHFFVKLTCQATFNLIGQRQFNGFGIHGHCGVKQFVWYCLL